tara:strand:+ start:2994 stop:3635 length:642 start_codon:yes stop_codon:yes gene_type:complete
MFADEAGCFNFNRSNRASRYFILCSVTMTDTSLGQELLQLRRSLALDKHQNNHFLHATADPWPIREKVYTVLADGGFRIDATIYQKSKAQPHTRRTDADFYKHIWYFHLKYCVPRIVRNGDRILITGAALGKNKKKAAFKEAINNTAQQLLQPLNWEVSFVQSAEDPCLWAADYCAWAIQRKWELNCRRAYDMISDHIRSEFDQFRSGTTEYY